MLSKNVAKLSGCNMGHAVAARLFLPRGVPSIRAKPLTRTKISSAVPSTAFFAREVEDQDSGNLTLNHISVEDRFHQPSIRPSTSTMILLCEHPALCGMRERPINNLRSSLRRPGPAPSCSRPPQDQTNPRCELFPPPLSPT